MSERHDELARLFFGVRDKGQSGAFGAGFRGARGGETRGGESGEEGDDVEGLAEFRERYSGLAR